MKNGDTVDGRNPAPVDRWYHKHTIIFRVSTIRLVQDFATIHRIAKMENVCNEHEGVHGPAAIWTLAQKKDGLTKRNGTLTQ